MRIPSASTDRKIYFVAVDITDLKTRETSLSSFTVVYSLDGAADVTYTTPTVAEIDASTMPGVYALTLDEGTTLAAGHDTEEYCLHITQASMAPVTRVLEIYRPKFTEGQAGTMANSAVDADIERLQGSLIATPTVAGVLEVDVTHWIGTAAATPTVAGVPEVDVTHWRGTAVPAEHTAGYPIVTIKDGTGTGEINTNAGAVALVDLVTTTTTTTTATNLTNLPSIPANWLTAAGTAADFGTEIATAIWTDTVAGDFTVAASIGKSVMNGVALGTGLTINAYTGNTVQTGDSFARLGAPAAASVSADILAIDNFVDDLETRLGTPTDLGSGATISANLVDIEGQTDDIGVAGAGLTAVPWNASWDAEVQSEVDDALVARSLHKLVTVSGTADSGSTTTMVDAARTEGDADYWKGSIILFTSGTLSGQARIITDFNAGTDTFTFAPPTTQAVATHDYVILPGISVWDDTLAEHLAAGSTGAALNAAGAAGDPWSTALPGAYGAGTAGFIVGTNIDALISSRLAPTVAGRTLDVTATGTGGVDWANVEGQGTSVNLSATTTNLVNTVTAYTGNTPQTGDSFARLGVPAGASVSVDVAAIQSDTNDIQTRLPAVLVGGRMDSSVGAMAADVITAAAIANGAIDAATFAAGAIDATAFAQGAADKVWLTAARTLTAFSFSVTVGTNNDKTGYALSAAGLDSVVIETGMHARQALSVIVSTTGGKLSGAGSGTEVFKAAVENTTTRVTATVDVDGNRTAITYNLPS